MIEIARPAVFRSMPVAFTVIKWNFDHPAGIRYGIKEGVVSPFSSFCSISSK